MSSFDEAMKVMSGEKENLTKSFSDIDLANLAYAYGVLETYFANLGHKEMSLLMRNMSLHFSDCLDEYILLSTELQDDDIVDNKIFEIAKNLSFYKSTKHFDRGMTGLGYLVYISSNAFGQVEGQFKALSEKERIDHCANIIDLFYNKIK